MNLIRALLPSRDHRRPALACAAGVGCLYVVRHRHAARSFRAVHSSGLRDFAYSVRPHTLHARGPVQADIATAGLNAQIIESCRPHLD
jgi:hypothetical protein